MNNLIHPLHLDTLDPNHTTKSLENGQVLYFPNYSLQDINASLLSDSILDGKHKNVSYDYQKGKLGGYDLNQIQLVCPLENMMKRYAEFALDLVSKALPNYIPHLRWGRTSFRPAEIEGRPSSKRKDDTRLHVDAFPATPVYGQRILRIFCNIHPQGLPRVWHVGEPFKKVLSHFDQRIPEYSLLKAQVLHWIRATKTLRSAYDHYMLHLHDAMKLDDNYQAEVPKLRFEFPAMSTWIVFTDQVSHAALSGQHLLEQTFYLPVYAMKSPETSPLKQLEKIKSRLLVLG